MVNLSLIAAISLAAGVFAAPSQQPSQVTDIALTPKSALANYFFSFWSEKGSFNCNNGPGGQYSINWNNKGGGFVCGKGWSTGGARTVKYSGTYNPTGPGYLAIYGWTRNPLIEYYIIESHGDLSPNEPWTSKGNFTFEEGTYELFQSTRVNQPSIDGQRTFQQYWSVRTEKRVGGIVSTGRHFQEWAKAGMRLGNHNYMIVATEGYTSGNTGSSGSASITVE